MEMPSPAGPSIVDFAGLEQLRRDAASGGAGALDEAAVQFEALMIGMMLKSARETSLGEGLFDSAATRDYLDLMDQQVALEMARKGGLGIGAALAPELARTSKAHDAAALDAQPARFESRQAFVDAVLPLAERAGRKLGVDPKILVAQAALETGWGRSVPRHPDGRAGHNLFGIKAGGLWHGARVRQTTLEHVDGALQRGQASFRAYADIAESFEDYTRLIAESPRYAKALEHGGDPRRFAEAVAEAGYATDPEYAQKWLAVYADEAIGGAPSLKETVGEPTT